jgi:(1->4)-alpha-D-glucan 1-alpha-D-glucosylmutase
MIFKSPIAGKVIRATYRLQFHEGFRLVDALALVPYLHDLCISHIYASPLTKAVPHSRHGYDVCDFQQLNPELGTEEDLQNLVMALRERGMGLVVDIVPNHMAASTLNPWWQDVLAHGRESHFANFFDVDWETADARTRGKVLLPVLGGTYAEALEQKKLQLKVESDATFLCYGENRFPVTLPEPLNGEAERINADPTALDEVIQRQNYRLTFWKHGDSELNYRRFFTITSLAGLRAEDEKVFEASHQLVKKWSEAGWVDGWRVDHPDGLREPGHYLQRLRQLVPKSWVVVEKILMADECLPTQWPVAGTTGYDFLNRVNVAFVDLEGEPALTEFYAKFTGRPVDYERVLRDKKRAVLESQFMTEINRLVQLLPAAASRESRWRDFKPEQLHAALIGFIASFPVYRTYRGEGNEMLTEAERAQIDKAVKTAQAERPQADPEIYNMLGAVVSGPMDGAAEFIARFQQLTGPAMAKGAEDGAFYCYNRFVSLNEVGGNPGHFGADAKFFHDYCAQVQAAWPETLLASTTHDTKRGEDLRARLNVISEMPEKWAAAVERWSEMNRKHRGKSFGNRNAEYLIYQTLAGAWPVSVERMLAYMEKAAREAGEFTHWNEPDAEYENALRDFITGIMADKAFMEDMETFVGTISRAGFVNSLAQTLIKLTAPGVPDIYQGCELWNFSLVDPDNRQPVDFKIRRQLLRQAKDLPGGELWKCNEEPMVKIWLIRKTLELRAAKPEFFALATYSPLYATGDSRTHLIAFQRGENVITVVPRLTETMPEGWRDTVLHLPEGEWQNVFTEERFDRGVLVKKLLERFPVALLVRKGPEL